jgi:hypothetical protein
MQPASAGQATRHAPQCVLPPRVSTQAPSQQLPTPPVDSGQLVPGAAVVQSTPAVHVPSEQKTPTPQLFPHAEQFPGSRCGSMQVPLQHSPLVKASTAQAVPSSNPEQLVVVQ